ncbi:hypothetical protein [Achromobacter phage nyashin_LB6]|nr:hypothetical protein [Achromobacter phage nyashin_LB6]
MATTPYLPNGMVLRGDQTSPLTQTEVDLNWLSLRGGGMIQLTATSTINTLVTPGLYYWSNFVPDTANGWPSGLPQFGFLRIFRGIGGNDGTDAFQHITAYRITSDEVVSTYVRRIRGGTTPDAWAANLTVSAWNRLPTTNLGRVAVVNSNGVGYAEWNGTLGRYVKVFDRSVERIYHSSSTEQGSIALPVYVYDLEVELIGGGGGGGAGDGSSAMNGGGGGGGGSGARTGPYRFTHDFAAGVLTYVIGVGGTGGKSGQSPVAPTRGGTTTISTRQATGGYPGENATPSYIYGAPGSGTNGSDGGQPGSQHHGGAGGPGYLGRFASGGVLNTSGNVRDGAMAQLTNYGGGGGGGSGKVNNPTAAGNGGNGAAGCIILRY